MVTIRWSVNAASNFLAAKSSESQLRGHFSRPHWSCFWTKLHLLLTRRQREIFRYSGRSNSGIQVTEISDYRTFTKFNIPRMGKLSINSFVRQSVFFTFLLLFRYFVRLLPIAGSSIVRVGGFDVEDISVILKASSPTKHTCEHTFSLNCLK